MKNMFYNYDHPRHFKNPLVSDDGSPKIMVNDMDPFVLLDVKGHEIGVCARRDSDFEIYFNLSGSISNTTIADYICNSSVKFELISRQYQHDCVFEKIFIGSNCYIGDADNGSIVINIDNGELADLELNSYKVKLTIISELDSYVIYPDNCGLLILR